MRVSGFDFDTVPAGAVEDTVAKITHLDRHQLLAVFASGTEDSVMPFTHASEQ